MKKLTKDDYYRMYGALLTEEQGEYLTSLVNLKFGISNNNPPPFHVPGRKTQTMISLASSSKTRVYDFEREPKVFFRDQYTTCWIKCRCGSYMISEDVDCTWDKVSFACASVTCRHRPPIFTFVRTVDGTLQHSSTAYCLDSRF